MSGRAGRSNKCWRLLRWAGLAAAVPAFWACTSRSLETPQITPTETLTTMFTQKVNNEIDILFMIDNSSSMTEMQGKLYDQFPLFMQILQALPTPPSLHVAVVSSDMGAPGDATSSISCTAQGNQGEFQSAPRSDTDLGITCTDTTLAAGATFISDADMMPNYTNPDISKVFQCIALLGHKGCGFEHQLASIDRALGSDNYDANGVPQPPSTNANFLRPEAYLGVVILTNEDDCSAPPGTQLYSENGYQDNAANPLGPLANYRCNQFGHLCTAPGGQVIAPPFTVPGNPTMQGGSPTLDLTDCTSNDTNGLLTPVSQFVSDIKRLKTSPDDQILIATISAPASPYTVQWVPASPDAQNPQPGELWPQVMHSCGAAGGDDVNQEATMSPTDGSFGDPGVRIAQFAQTFKQYLEASICDDSYATSMQAIAKKLGALITPPCLTGQIQNDANNNPMCSVIEHLQDMQGNKTDRGIQNCNANGNVQPCWTLTSGGTKCANGQQLMVNDSTGQTAQMASSTINCSVCLPGSTAPGCPCPNDPTKMNPSCT
jgi:hypothetical protein